MKSKRNLHVRLERLEEALAPNSNGPGCVIEYDEHTTPAEIEAMKAERAAKGARVFVLMPKKGGEPELILRMSWKEATKLRHM